MHLPGSPYEPNLFNLSVRFSPHLLPLGYMTLEFRKLFLNLRHLL